MMILIIINYPKEVCARSSGNLLGEFISSLSKQLHTLPAESNGGHTLFRTINNLPAG